MEPLALRLGPDMIQRLESAAVWRYEDGCVLARAGRFLAAVYLWGYVAEMRLGTAYFRLVGLDPEDAIAPSVRKAAVEWARGMRLMGPQEHDILGWVRLVLLQRKERKQGFSRDFETLLVTAASGIDASWRPVLRYRALPVSHREAAEVQCCALWFEQNHTELWR